MSFNLMLHCGAEAIDRTDPVMTMTPEPMGPRHNPFPYIHLVDAVQRSLTALNMRVKQEQFGALKDGSRFFGLMEVGNGYEHDDFTTIIGLRAAHDQELAAGLVAGSGVFVCDNLAFSGEVKLSTRQTTNVLDRLDDLVYEAASRTRTLIQRQGERFDQYKHVALPNHNADAAITGLVRAGAILPSHVGKVIQEWDRPSHEEFTQGRNVWRLYNAVTEQYKPTGEHTTVPRAIARSGPLQRVCDELAGMRAAA